MNKTIIETITNFDHWKIDNEWCYLYTEHKQFASSLQLMYGDPMVYSHGGSPIGWQFKVKYIDLDMLRALLLSINASISQSEVPSPLEPTPVDRSHSSQDIGGEVFFPDPTKDKAGEKITSHKGNLEGENSGTRLRQMLERIQQKRPKL